MSATANRTPPTLLPASVPAPVRDAWAVLDHDQRAALLDLLADYARQATAPAAPAPAPGPVRAAPAPVRSAEPDGSTLEARADLALLGAARWVVTCRNCGAERPARAPSAGRLPSGLCDRCAESRKADRAKRRAARQREAE